MSDQQIIACTACGSPQRRVTGGDFWKTVEKYKKQGHFSNKAVAKQIGPPEENIEILRCLNENCGEELVVQIY